MDGFVAFILARPRWVIACILAVTALFARELRSLEPRVSLRDLTPAGHAYRAVDDRLADEFAVGQTAIVAVGVERGDVFRPDVIARVQRLTEAVEALPGVEPQSVLSLASRLAREVSSGPDGLRIAPLSEVAGDPEALREAVLSQPAYRGLLVTPDARGAMLLADFSEREPPERATRALEALAARERAPGIEVLVGGQSPALAALQDATRRILPLVLLALAIVAAVHYQAFRTLQAVFLPLVTAVLSVIWAMGLTSLLGVRLTPWTAVTAVLVVSVAAGHAVQILKRYYECYAELGDNRAAVSASLRRIGPVTAIACFIAAAGFASLATFGVPAVRDFGMMASCGILSTLVLELSFIPAVRVLLRSPRSGEARREREHRLVDRALDAIGRSVVARPARVLALGVGASLAIGLGAARIEVNTAFRSWFDSDEPVIVADRAIRERYTGTSTIRVLVEADEPEALLAPRALRGLDAVEGVLRAEPDVTASISLADALRTLHRAMRGDGADASLPDDPALIAQYLLLLDGPPLDRLLAPDHRAAAIHALARSDDVRWVDGVFARLRAVAAREMPPDVRVRVAGGELAQALANNETVVREKMLNLLQVSAVIFALSALAFRSLAAGLLVLTPLACAVAVNLGTMGWVGSSLSFATASYTAMGVSLGADLALYLLFRLREELATHSLDEALRVSLRTAGSAILSVASAIACGYASLLASDFALWRQLGAYVALMMATSALATLTVLPAAVRLLRPRFLLPDPAER